MSDAALIGVDWGTSNRRAWLFHRDGKIIDSRRDGHGIRARRASDYAADLAMLVDGWPSLPTLLSGMIGSRDGWQETAYVPCPAGPSDIAAGVAPLAGRTDMFIVPGVSENGIWIDVMRGEETQILGLSEDSIDPALVVVPGTHSKWVRVTGGRIDSFRTFPTGELFATILDHTVIGAVADCRTINERAFESGLAAAETDAGILALLFSARARVLLGEMPPADCASYLSGLLIASEVRDGLGLFGSFDRCALVGRDPLVARYSAALARAGVTVSHEGEDTAAVGLWRLAAEAGIVPQAKRFPRRGTGLGSIRETQEQGG